MVKWFFIRKYARQLTLREKYVSVYETWRKPDRRLLTACNHYQFLPNRFAMNLNNIYKIKESSGNGLS